MRMECKLINHIYLGNHNKNHYQLLITGRVNPVTFIDKQHAIDYMNTRFPAGYIMTLERKYHS